MTDSQDVDDVTQKRTKEEDAQRYPDHDNPRRVIDPGEVRDGESGERDYEVDDT